MRTRQKPTLSAGEQAVLDGVTVRLVESGERERFDQLLVEQHYLHNAEMVGERLCYVAEWQGQWLALLSWSAPAYRLKPRESWIGWTEGQRRRRLGLVVNNSRFLILEHAHYPNLASRVMRLCTDRLSEDWEKYWNHALLVAESFVDVQVFRGTCYKVSGWQELGLTQGYGRKRGDFYLKHDRPKQLWVRELHPGARELLKARTLPPKYAVVEDRTEPVCEATPEDLGEARKFFERVADWRKKIGDYCCAGLVALVACASLCGVQRGQRDLAAFARTLSSPQLRALGFRKKGRPRRYHPPSETTFYRFLTGVDSDSLQEALLAWQDWRLGARRSDDDVLSLDGKTLLSSQGVEVVSAYAVKSGRWIGSRIVEQKSNEIPAAQQLLRDIPVREGDKVTLDALHTQHETAQIIVQERGVDYLLCVKGNQPGIAETLMGQGASRRAFPPYTSDGLGGAV
ncbi:MAG: ISAs1 family transposase [Planctomycetota bacterium]